jgi:hypothetical protein
MRDCGKKHVAFGVSPADGLLIAFSWQNMQYICSLYSFLSLRPPRGRLAQAEYIQIMARENKARAAHNFIQSTLQYKAMQVPYRT